MSDGARETKKFNKKRKSLHSDQSPGKKMKQKKTSIVSTVTDDEDFPRGGSSSLTPLEIRQIRNDAEKDILFGVDATKSRDFGKTKKKVDKTTNVQEPKNKVFTDDQHGENVENLTFKSLSKGDLLLGVIQEIHEFELLISLPNNLTGSVNISNINEAFTSQLEANTENEKEDSTSLHKFFSTGSMVKCVVNAIDSTKRGHSKIKLSLAPSQVNTSLTINAIYPNMIITGYVASIEDHGYSMSLGVDGVSGFLPKKYAPDLCIGKIVDCLVVSVNEARKLVQLQYDEEKIKTTVTKHGDKVVFSSLLPGMLVKSSVKEVSHNGMVVNFLGHFTGTISLLHLKNHGIDGGSLEETYPLKTKLLSRIMFVRPSKKVVGLCSLTKVVNYEPYSLSDVSIGDVFEEATVSRCDQGRGILMSLSDVMSGYAHISRLTDEHVAKIDVKKFKPGTSHRCRILNFNNLLGLAMITLQPSVIDEPFIRYQDIKPGDVVTGVVKTFLKFGMLVTLSEHIRGYCASIHYADVPLKNPEKKLYEGKKVNCRVMFVDAERKRLHLTLKKSLVNSDLPAITNYSDIEVGMKCCGYIASIRDFGCIIHFYNRVHGIVRKADLGLKASEDPSKAFYIGQVVSCVVLSCFPAGQKLALSFNLSAKPNTSANLLGKLVKVDVIAKSHKGLDVQIPPSNTPAFIPVIHLSDHQEHCSALLETFAPSAGKKGELKSLKNVLCYGKSKDKSIIVTRRQSLIKRAVDGHFIKQFEDLEVGMVLPGFVRQTMPYGIFIEFSPNVLGLAPNSFLSDKYIADGSQYFKIGRTVVAKIVEIHADRRRFLVSLKPSDCFPATHDTVHNEEMVNLLEEFLHEREGILENLTNLRDIVPGSVVPAKVTALKSNGMTFQLLGGIVGFAPPQLTKGVNTSVDEVCDALVLDYNMNDKQVCLTLDPNTIRLKKTNSAKKVKLKQGQVVPAIIQLINKDYIVVILPDHDLKTAYIPIKSNMNDVTGHVGRFTAGQKCSVTIERCLKSATIIASVENSKESKPVIKPGDIVTAVVRSIKNLQMNVHLSGGKYHGRVHVTEVTDDVTENVNPLTHFKCGENIQVKVLGFRDAKKHNFLPITHRNFSKAVAELSTRPSRLNEEVAKNDVDRKVNDYKKGEKILCFVKSVDDKVIWMSVSTSVDGRVALLEVSRDVKVLQNLSNHFNIGVAYQCTVIDLDEQHKSLNLSMNDCDVKKGQIVPGRIIKIYANKGILVHLPGKMCGFASMTDLKDEFKDDPLSEYSVGQLLSCFVLAVGNNDQIDLSTRPSKTEGESSASTIVDKDIQSFDDIEEGDIVRGYVKTVSDVGIFVSLSRTIAARVQIKNLSQYFVKNWKPLFPVGKLVKGKVLSIDPCSNKIELSLKGLDVGDTDPAPKPEKRESESSKRSHENGDDGLLKKRRKEEESENESKDEESSDEGSSESGNENKENHDKNKPRLNVSVGFDWNSTRDEEIPENGDDDATDSDDADDDVDKSTQVARKKTKREKRAAKKAEEEFLYKTEQALLDQNKGPQTTEEFDRALLATPNDSLLWLQYMAFYLHITEIDKARGVAERALKSISFREESEKFNVWIGLLNLENNYGTQESLVKVFTRALEENEPKNVFEQLANIYIKSNKFELVEQLYQTMVKRFKTSKKVWTDYGAFLMERGELKSARNLLQRSLKSLEKRKHVETITKFAMLEFKHGEPERGRTLLDNIMTSYPKRTDIWSMYVDVLVRNNDIDGARRLLEKEVMLKLSSRKMKFVFKKFLEFEKKHGDESTVSHVKKMAEDFVREKTT